MKKMMIFVGMFLLLINLIAAAQEDQTGMAAQCPINCLCGEDYNNPYNCNKIECNQENLGESFCFDNEKIMLCNYNSIECLGCGGFYEWEIKDCTNGCGRGACINSETQDPIPEYPQTEPILIQEYPQIEPTSIQEIPEPNQDYIKETVKCIFNGATTEQRCYAADRESSCTANLYTDAGDYGACIVDVKGIKDETITWKSTCGGYAYTTMDGENEYATFKCIPSEEVEEVEELRERGFNYAYWQCYDGAELRKGSENVCRSSEDWQSDARQFCEGHCYADGSKCGVNSFSVSNECYVDEMHVVVEPKEEIILEKPEIAPPSESIEQIDEAISSTQELEEDTLVCKDSCPLNEKCYPFGYRKSGQYCSDAGSFVNQLEADLTCDNNFECSSNLCIDSQCISGSLFQKMISWFKRLFG